MDYGLFRELSSEFIDILKIKINKQSQINKYHWRSYG